jgi:ferredoxin
MTTTSSTSRPVRLALLCSLFARSEAWLPSHSHHNKRTSYCSQIESLAPSRLASSKEDDGPILGEETGFLVEVTYEGRSCKVPIFVNETLLTGMERARVPDQLAIPELPSECRRGNCLTCAGRHTNSSQESSLRRGEDGLSPYISRQASKSGYVLTCSSYVTGDGVKLDLGENHHAWTALHRDRLYEESTQYVARKAMARTIRKSDEKNPERWAVETKTALEKSGD